MAIGYRIHKSGEGVGSILLGLYRDDGELQMVGGAASFTVKDRLKLLADLEPLREGDQVNDGEPSRWNSAADKRWIPVRPEKVVRGGLRPDGGQHAARPTLPARREVPSAGGPTASRRAARSTSSTCR